MITSASNKFFPCLIDMLGSLHKNYPNHPNVFICDLGLSYPFKQELSQIPWVKILPVPHFCLHWRSCYTWKTYILNTPLADLNFYIDAGCEILAPLDPLFEKINNQGYLAVSQGHEVLMRDITPISYFKVYGLDEKFMNSEIIAAGVFGFKKNSVISTVTEKLYDAGEQGLCLGYSQNEQWKNKGVNKTAIVPDCKMFRHDTTILSVLLYKNIPNLIVEPLSAFNGELLGGGQKQYILTRRLNFRTLKFTDPSILHEKSSILAVLNRFFIKAFLALKEVNRRVKKLP